MLKLTQEQKEQLRKECHDLIKKGVADYNKADLIKIFSLNSQYQPKAIYSNNTIINMLNSMNETTTITTEPTRKNDMVNRGSVVECLVKSAVIDYVYNTDNVIVKKSAFKVADLDTSKMNIEMLEDLGLPQSKNIEIKFSTSFASATPKDRNNKAHYTIVCNNEGAYLVRSKDLLKDNYGHIKPEQPNGEYLETLSEMLGY